MQAISIAIKRPIWSLNEFINSSMRTDLSLSEFCVDRKPIIITLGGNHWSGVLMMNDVYECKEPLYDADTGFDFILSNF